ncbi:hypothetical protein DBR23_03620 [Acidovorax sp. HMWF018]|uniref:phage adaptor protein n=1 Tax=Acidovorax sp. HMWF018 TaxID=2056855 RepID=UPI000D3D1EC7|nr:DUF6682 family protein [Acidovorax sp. HMWF018]MBI2750809.1 hypothetical protein [Burkholderiales bacterium]PTT42355.1 hypothetical protein DBR23_03620 [Acidovorax sp. HMWF018]
MNLEQLIEQFRIDADDLQTPPLWDAEWVAAWLTEAQAEAAVRGRLLFEAADPAICEIAVTAGVATYPLHKSLYELEHLRFKATGATTSDRVHLKTREELDRIRPGWRDRTDSRPCFAIQDDTRITLVDRPSVAGTLFVEGYRLPLKALANDNDKPEINEAHHRHLVHWALHRAFSKPDADAQDKTRAATEEAAFTAYFGPRPDSDLRRSTRHDEVQTNKSFMA